MKQTMSLEKIKRQLKKEKYITKEELRKYFDQVMEESSISYGNGDGIKEYSGLFMGTESLVKISEFAEFGRKIRVQKK